MASSPSIPSRTHLRQFSPPHQPSALKLYEQSAPALTSMLSISLAQHFPTSVLIQEQRYESKTGLQMMKDDKTSQATLNRIRLETEPSGNEENYTLDGDQYLEEFRSQVLHLPGLRSRSLHVREEPSLSLTMQSVLTEPEKLMDAELHNVVALARKALSAAKEAALLTEDCETFVANLDEVLTQSSGSTCFPKSQVEKVKTVRSTRLLERQSKKRRLPNSIAIVPRTSVSKTVDSKQTSKNVHSNDPLGLFLASSETKQLLTAKEESELIVRIKDFRSLEKVKSRLRIEFGRDPTVVEWAGAIGLSCHALQSRVNFGKRSGEKLVCSNFRMVVHIAKKYQGYGLNLQDLLQEGSVGLMRSVDKYNPQSGCRFATYAYWWIKQAIKKAIHQNSRTIRLPVNVYDLMYKVTEAKRLCIQEGNHEPTKEQIAVRAGITVERLQKLRVIVRKPLSMEQCVWRDQDTTFQEITADTRFGSPNMTVEKQFMRNHVRNLLKFLPPREGKIIRLRYGIGGGIPKTLADAGLVMGISDERVRKLESQGLNKLKQLMSSHGLGEYAELLV